MPLLKHSTRHENDNATYSIIVRKTKGKYEQYELNKFQIKIKIIIRKSHICK